MIYPFATINVDRMTEGPTTVYWTLVSHFKEPGPYRFRVQHSSVGTNEADDWKDVGTEGIETAFAVDNTKRDYAKAINAHYRVIVNTGISRHISAPVTALQFLNTYQHRIATEKTRRNKKALLSNPETRSGYILLRRRTGPDCTRCYDPKTQEATDANCPVCYGTGKLGGYFKPIPDQHALITPRILLERVEPNMPTRGDDVREGIFLGYPQLRTYDVFVDDRSDERFIMHTVKIADGMRSTPLVQNPELAVLDFSNVVYKFPLETI